VSPTSSCPCSFSRSSSRPSRPAASHATGRPRLSSQSGSTPHERERHIPHPCLRARSPLVIIQPRQCSARQVLGIAFNAALVPESHRHGSASGKPIHCGERCRDLTSGYGRPIPRYVCGVGECASGIGRRLTYHCSRACYWRHRRARSRVAPRSRKCAWCGSRFTPQRRADARTCSSKCRQTLYRQRVRRLRERRKQARGA
jgi:predicted nucleic acid-binding Zn ribbon protein